MKLKALSVQGFKSFRRQSTFEFAESAGLYFVTGNNRVEPELGANGAGKSTIWDALVWCLYGKTARGARASSVGNWEGSSLCIVALEFEDPAGKPYTLKRCWSPNSLSLTDGDAEPRRVEQEEVDKLLGLSYSQFMLSVVTGQFSTAFIDLPGPDKMKVLADALDLSFWDDASAEAKKHLVSAVSLLEEREEDLRSVKTKLGKVDDFLKQIDGYRADWEKQRAADLKVIASEAKRFENMAKITSKKLDGSASEYDDLKEKEERLSKRVRVLKKKCDKIELKMSRVSGRITADLEAKERYVARYKEAASKKGKLCSSCGQQVTASGQNTYLTELDNDIKEHQERVAVTKEQLANMELSRGRLRRKHKDRSEKLQLIVKKISALEAYISSLRAEIRDYSNKIKSCEQEADRKKHQTNPYDEQREEQEQAAKKLKKERKQIKKELLVLKPKYDDVKYWVNGFKDVRLWLLQEACRELEVIVNSSLQELGLGGWTVGFDIERENSSGGITRGFTVLITSPDSTEPAAWECWSGGEAQRLRIAISVGVAKLIQSRTGSTFGVEIWDEPTQHLSEQGISDLLDYFANRASLEQQQVYLVDHRSIEFAGFDGEWEVEKTKKGSKIRRIN